MATQGEFEKRDISDIPCDPAGYAMVDFFVRLPSVDRYVRFVVAGDMFTETKRSSLLKHTAPEIYIAKEANAALASALSELSDSTGAPALEASPSPTATPAAAPTPSVDTTNKLREAGLEVLDAKQNQELNDISMMIIKGTRDPIEQMKVITTQTDSILAAVAPDVKHIKEHLTKTSKLLNLMHDSAAITTIAVLFAMANDFGSKKSYRDLAMACLVMDSGLIEFGEQDVKQYYTDRSQLPPDTLAKMNQHPIRSHDLAKNKLTSLSDGTIHLILSHHELFSGKGFPRGIRSESLFPLTKVLAFAVDVYETLKKADYNNSPILIEEAVAQFKEEGVEPHLRRHARVLVDKVVKFMSPPIEPVA